MAGNNNRANVLLIGGTGRCGTNLLKNLLSTNNDVFSLPFETRFTIDPDGIVDFLNTVKNNWNPYVVSEKIDRLGLLLKKLQSNCKMNDSYIDWELDRHIPNFEIATIDLMQQLRSISFYGTWCGDKSDANKMHYATHSYEELIEVFRGFSDTLVDGILKKNTAKVYVEDNTWNVLHADYLQDLFSRPKLIHVYRAPRDVVASLLEQSWMPNDIEHVVSCYKKMIDIWRQKKELLNDNFFIEVKFEDLVSNPKKIISDICDFAQLELQSDYFDSTIVSTKSSNIGGWGSRLTDSQRRYVMNNLQEEEEYFGYV